MQTTLLDWLETNEGDDKKESNIRQEFLREQNKREIKNARIALIKTGLKAEEINVETLPGNIVGKMEAMKITVDPVVFRDLTFAQHTLEHEKAHQQGIKSEAIAELIAAVKANDTVAPEYVSAVSKLKVVADVIGWQTTLDLYQKESYEWLFKIFVANSMKKSGVSYQDCIKKFESAFPELEVKVSKN
ncbi:hypothetical protein HZA39_00180 [Candidatus Peregrinibacteria bacterium]|nr:hypothetical protein [Candidatus Peregrinibacteria bacterium]